MNNGKVFDGLSDQEVLELVYEAYKDELSKRNPDDYEVNQEQMDKFTSAYSFFFRLAKEDRVSVEPIRFSPTETSGGIIVYTHYLDFCGLELVEFCKVLLNATAIDFMPMTDGRVCISMTIPEIFKPKSNP